MEHSERQRRKRIRRSGYYVRSESNLSDSGYFAVVEDDYSSSSSSMDEESVPLYNPSAQTRDWNDSYQAILDSSDWVFGGHLTHISMEFGDTALTYGKIIISEVALPLEQKTIKPRRMGGMAGGDKFVVHGILFKFAADSLVSDNPPVWLYGGSQKDDAAAAKAASHELIARDRWFLRSDSESILRFPLLVLITYKGFRLIAMSMLPIDTSTLIYGSDDGGTHVRSLDPSIASCVETAAARLNLCTHTVGRSGVVLAGPGDMEVHRGKDGRVYMLDTGRTMPPEAPPPLSERPPGYNPRAIFSQLLRPALVERYQKPLNSDAFSAFCDHDPLRATYNKDVHDATQYLYNQVIPAFAADLDRRYGRSVVEAAQFGSMDAFFAQPRESPASPAVDFDHVASGASAQDMLPRFGIFDHSQVGSFLQTETRGEEQSVFAALRERLQAIAAWRLHKHGINARHLGRIRSLLQCDSLRRTVLSVIAARCMKQELDQRMRELMSDQKRGVPSDEPFKRLACSFFNMCFEKGSQDECTSYWKDHLRAQIVQRFPCALSTEELQPCFDLRASVSLRTVFVMAVELSAMRLAPDAERYLLETASDQRRGPFELRDIDVLEIGSRIKASQITMYTRSVHMLLLGLETSNPRQALRILKVAHKEAVDAWRLTVGGEVQRLVLAVVEFELAILGNSAHNFTSAMQGMWDVVSTWPADVVLCMWDQSLLYAESLIKDGVTMPDLVHWRNVLASCNENQDAARSAALCPPYMRTVTGFDKILTAMHARNMGRDQQ